ncbi:MAG: type II toxin-antitoxin system Phd/YefM family antitoxin [Clostridia bacterium]|nr:type II toxin-antitoxin system Phd/YefM family antitoxin [Clostridia bacterium]
MTQIIPMKDLRDTNKICEMCRAADGPIFVTKNGYGELVIMSMQTYEDMRISEIHDKILNGQQQIREGKYVDGPSFMEELKKEYVK